MVYIIRFDFYLQGTRTSGAARTAATPASGDASNDDRAHATKWHVTIYGDAYIYMYILRCIYIYIYACAIGDASNVARYDSTCRRPFAHFPCPATTSSGRGRRRIAHCSFRCEDSQPPAPAAGPAPRMMGYAKPRPPIHPRTRPRTRPPNRPPIHGPIHPPARQPIGTGRSANPIRPSVRPSIHPATHPGILHFNGTCAHAPTAGL